MDVGFGVWGFALFLSQERFALTHPVIRCSPPNVTCVVDWRLRFGVGFGGHGGIGVCEFGWDLGYGVPLFFSHERGPPLRTPRPFVRRQTLPILRLGVCGLGTIFGGMGVCGFDGYNRLRGISTPRDPLLSAKRYLR